MGKMCVEKINGLKRQWNHDKICIWVPIKSALVKVSRYIWSFDSHHSLGFLAWLFRRLSWRPQAIGKHSGPLAALEKWNTVRDQGRAEERGDPAPENAMPVFPTPCSLSPLPPLTPTPSVGSQRSLKAPGGFPLHAALGTRRRERQPLPGVCGQFSRQKAEPGHRCSPPGTVCTNAKSQIPPGCSNWTRRSKENRFIRRGEILKVLHFILFLKLLSVNTGACSGWLFAIPWAITHQPFCPWGVSRQEYCRRLPFPTPGDIPDSGIKRAFPALAARFFTTVPPGNLPTCVVIIINSHKSTLRETWRKS